MSLEDFEKEAGLELNLDGINLEDVPEQTTLPDGSEVNLRLVDIDIRVTKKGDGQYIYALLDPFDEPNAKLINHLVNLPKAGDTDKQKNNKLRGIRDFFKAFGIPLQNWEDLRQYIGNTSWAIVKEEDDDTGEYGPSNRVRKFVVGK